MAEVIRMPLLSDTMKEGVIAEWHKKVGDKVKPDDVIAEVETDKATMEVMPYVDGTILYIGVEKGKAAPVNGIIAIVGKEGEDYKPLLEAGGNSVPAAKEAAAPAAKQEEEAAPKAEKKAKPKPGDATVVRMPLLSDTMKEGKIVAWLKKVGDKVKSDDVLAEVETDKATMEVMGYADGVLLYVGVEAGSAAKVNDIIAIVGKEGTDVSAYLDEDDDDAAETAAPDETKQASAAPTPKKEATAPPAPETTAGSSSEDGRFKASPLARKIAQDKGIALSQLAGSGEGGRIIKRDIDNFTPKAAPAASAATAAAVAKFVPAGTEGYTDKPNSQMRKVVASRLSESKFSAPHFYLRSSVKMDKAIEARAAMNQISPVKISFNDFIIKASAMALRKHPAINSSWMGDFIRENHHIGIGTAVAIEDGLIVPVIKFADQKSVSQISAEAGELIKKARNKKLQPAEFTGNTFTISNLGMMDIDDFTAIINPPDSCILAVGKIEPTPVVEDGQIVVRSILRLTLSCDHRVVDGAVGAAFLQTLKTYLENPVTMLV
ncbi:MAG: pyruvate dehydrogenase complex dihydrolipoamide acetyltransferase [Edaphocola sp.]